MSTNSILAEEEEEENWKRAKKTPQILAAFAASLGSLSLGTVLGWTGNISDDLQGGKFNDISIDDDAFGWIGSLVNLGNMFSCLIIGSICDYFGRRNAMLLLIIPYVLGWLLIIFAQNVSMMYVGRFVGGFAGGSFCISVPLYVSETSEKHIRGALATMPELFLTTGIFISYTLGYLVDAKTVTIIVATFPILFGIFFITQPETPYYLLKNEREKDAFESLERLRGRFYNIKEEIKSIRDDIEEDKVNELPILQSFKKRETKIATLIVYGLMLFQQVCGVNAVVFYTSNIFKAAGIDESKLNPEVSTILVGIAQVVANVMSLYAVDRLGRRTLLAISGLFMAIPEILLALYFMFQDRGILPSSTLTTLGFIPVLSLCVFILSAEIGYGPVAWTVSVEISPSEMKNVLTSSGGAFNWFISFLVTKFYLNMKNSLGGDVTFFIFGGLSFLGAIFPLVFLPETKGKSLVEIQRELRGKGEVGESNNANDIKQRKCI